VARKAYSGNRKAETFWVKVAVALLDDLLLADELQAVAFRVDEL